MSRLRPWRLATVLLLPCLCFPLLPSVAARQADPASRILVSAPSSSAPDRAMPPRTIPLTPRSVRAEGLIRRADGWYLTGPSASLTMTFVAPVALRSADLWGALSRQATVSIEARTGGAWQAIGLEEPSERDGRGAFAAGPIPLRGTTLEARVTIQREPRRPGGVVLRALRLEGVARADGHTAPAGGAQAVNAHGGSPFAIAPSSLPAPRPRIVPAVSAWSRHAATQAALPARAIDAIVPDIISRVTWGAPDGEASPQWVPFSERPFQIIIHHSASPPGPGGPIADVQDIWSFHTLTRGWGDIGYNYVIDPEGRIYEGRAGGPEVTGAHTHGFNLGSVGIALLGDYTVEQPSAPMLAALARLIAALANRYGINPLALRIEEGITYNTIAGHRDFNQTDCPGDNVYRLLPSLRALVARQVRSSAALAGPAALYVTASRPGMTLLRIRNTGTTTWNGRFSLVRLSGPLLGLPGGFNVPDVPPGGTISIPLFLPALPAGARFATRWRLLDASGTPGGSSFAVTVQALPPGVATPTPAPTATATATPRPSATPRPRPHASATRTLPPSRTPIPHRRATATARRTATARASATPGRSATSGKSATPVATFTPVRTSTVAPTDTASPTATPSPTRRPSATPTGLIVPTAPLGADTGHVRPLAGTSLTLRCHGSVPPLRWGERYAVSFGGCGAPVTREAASARKKRRRIPDRRTWSVAPLYRTQRGSPSLRPQSAYSAMRPQSQVRPGQAPAGGAARIWYFAEGSSARTEREELDFLNPGPAPAYVITTLIRGDGHRVYAVTDVPPHGRGTLDAGDTAGLGDLLAAVVLSSEPIYTERALYHASQIEEGTGAALTPGNAVPAARWYVPRPRLQRDDQERLAILNPGATPVTAGVSLVEDGKLRFWRGLVIPPLAVRSLTIPGGAASAMVDATGLGVVVEERTVYGKGRGYEIHSGLTTLAEEGYVPAPADADERGYVMLFNPGAVPAAVTLSQQGAARVQHVVVRAGGELAPRLASGRQAGLVQVHADQPVAAAYLAFLPPGGERQLARNYRGSVAAALLEPARFHAFAAGDTRLLLSDPRESLLLANTGAGTAHISVSLLATGGHTAAQAVTLPPGGTSTLVINGWGPAGQHGLLVRADQPILAARAIDFNEGVDRLYSAGIAWP